MKKVILLSVVFMSVFVSCKKEKEIEEAPVTSEEIVVEEPVSEECYSAIIKKDTVSMSLNIKGNQIASGKLSYNFFEKDKNEGTLVGEIKGDTLFAEYTFMSEGVSSIRQVAFLKKGNTYVEGYGDVVDDNKGKVMFKDTKQLKFEGNVVLSKVDCKM
ncbi:hypothetical protein [Flavobacterium sp. GT3P67]|uniref:hypothetical protein n=1 Tax=Flavobacterium sp. GT3P67 TaxID=2541722 RepID=UPI00104990D4|nr:hypothetical protein [Flavobacterium sp. GT3P67]TDE52936.1 hypothetical protein E0H99_09640 [Flavobacterium sp. GT3P67]